MARKQVGAIDADLLARVDEFRGDVPRTRFVERALEAALGPARASAAVEEASGKGSGSAGNGVAVAESHGPPSPPASPRPPQTYKCPAGHPFPKPPTSPSARCPACSRVVVPA
jgi:hypothetical protein